MKIHELTKALHELDALRLEHIKLTAERDGLRAQVVPDVDALAQHIRTMGSKTGAGRLAESIVDWLAASFAAPAQQAAPSLTVGERDPPLLTDEQKGARWRELLPHSANFTSADWFEAGAEFALAPAAQAEPVAPTTTQAQAGEKQG